MTTALTASLMAAALLGGCSKDESVAVPDVVGMEDVEAWYAIGEAGLEWEAADPTWGRHTVTDDVISVVVSQNPGAGTTAEPGDTVTLTYREDNRGAVAPSLSTEGPTEEAGLASEIQSAFSDTYGWPEDPTWSVVESFDDRDAPRVTVATTLADKAENEAEALGICRAVVSLVDQVEAEYSGAYVTAGAGGPFLAECDTAN